MLRLVFSLLLLCAGALPAAAQMTPRACTQMWCQEGYMLQLQGQDWPHGHYSFKVIADNNVYNCEGSLPFNGCGTPSVTCNDKAVQVGESGCAMSPDTHRFHGIMLPEIPANISVSIAGPEGKVFAYENAVQKQCGFPNGESCDPRQCCSAMEAATVNW